MKTSKGFVVDPGWKTILHSIGVDAVDVLRCASLPGDLLAREDAWLKPAEYYRFWEAIESVSNNSCIALDLVSQMSSDVFDPVLFAALCSPNMRTALVRIAQFKPLIGPLRLDVRETDSYTSVSIDFSGIDLPIPNSLILGELAFFVQFARLATGGKIVPLSISCLLYTSPSPRDLSTSRMPSSA